MATNKFKVVICGDGAIGKTCLLDTLAETAITDWENPKYQATSAQNSNLTATVKGVGECDLEMWDTAGQESLESLRKVAYPDTDICLIGFNTCDKVTLDNVVDSWFEEFEEYCTDCQVVFLVGTKIDLLREKFENGDMDNCCDAAEIIRVANKINAAEIILTSAKTAEGIIEETVDEEPADACFFNRPESHEGDYLKDLIPKYCSKVYLHEEIPTVTDCGYCNTWASFLGDEEAAPPPAAEPVKAEEAAPAAAAPAAAAPAAAAPAAAAPAPAAKPVKAEEAAPAPGPAPGPATEDGDASRKRDNKPPTNPCCTVL